MAYISTEEVREIRKELKKQFPTYKFSVRKRKHSVAVNLLSSDLDLQREFRDPNESYEGINQYWLDDHWSAPVAKIFKKMLQIIKTAPAKAVGGEEWFDDSDSSIDYFNTAFYIEMSVGDWDKPYVLKK